MKARYTMRAESREDGAVIRCCQSTGEWEVKVRVFGNGLQGVNHCREREKPEEKRKEGEGGEDEGCSGDESCGTIFHSRQKHLLGYQFGAEKQSSPPAPSSIIFLY